MRNLEKSARTCSHVLFVEAFCRRAAKLLQVDEPFAVVRHRGHRHAPNALNACAEIC